MPLMGRTTENMGKTDRYNSIVVQLIEIAREQTGCFFRPTKNHIQRPLQTRNEVLSLCRAALAGYNIYGSNDKVRSQLPAI